MRQAHLDTGAVAVLLLGEGISTRLMLALAALVAGIVLVNR